MRYVLGSLLPALLLLVIAAGAHFTGDHQIQLAEPGKLAALEEALLSKVQTETLPLENARGVVTTTIEMNRQGREVLRASGDLLRATAPFVVLLAFWVALGGYDRKKSN